MAAYVYILSSKRHGTLYTGVTADLGMRVAQHKDGVNDGFTKKYGVHMLVYAEAHECIEDAIKREKAIKKWNRDWKIELIEKANPEWKDITETIS